MSDTRKIKIGMILALIQLCMLAITLCFNTVMDARFVEQFGCSPAEMAQQIREADHDK